MKGKGKGKEMPERECPLQFPDFSLIDMSRMCPRISSVLSRRDEESVGLEDMDVIQLELETLLTSVTKRMHLLQGEMQVLINHDKKDKKCAGGKVQPELPAKRGKPCNDDRPSKKFKDNSSKAGHSSPIPTPRPAKNKNIQAKTADLETNEVPDLQRKVPKNDAPNRFWNSVEPFCADISQDDIKFLEELVSQHEDNSDYYKIPTLGKHYSLKWAQEDMLTEQKEGSKPNEKKKSLTNGVISNDSDKLISKAEKECDSEDNAPFGALTQRLVSCLIEENLMSSFDEYINEPLVKDSSDGTNGIKGNGIKTLNAKSASSLERRIRKELEEQGLLDIEDHSETNTNDEVLAELKKCQNDLKTISAYNLVQTKNLLKLAKEAVVKQELKQKLQLADAEVKEMFRKIQLIKQKKKIPSKKEKDMAWKALKERANIIKQLNAK